MTKFRHWLDLAAPLFSMATLIALATLPQHYPQPALSIYLSGAALSTVATLMAGIALTASSTGPTIDREKLSRQGNRIALWSTILHAATAALGWAIILAQ